MKKKAYAKINIALDVVGKREDGYHLLKMIMQTIDLYDIIEIKKNNIENINLTCNKHYIPTDERNLAYKAAKIFKQEFNVKSGIDIDIKKNIPVAAGLAGGSTDAAAVLELMNKLFKINANRYKLEKLALKIGADVPYCIKGGTALCEGIGEKITPLEPFNNKILVVVKPNFGVSTKDVYNALDVKKIYKHANIDGLIEAMKKQNIIWVAKNMKNVLENVTLKKHIILKNIKDDMNKMGAINSMMSGSGPTIFAFFEDMSLAQKCYEGIKEKYKYNDIYITRTIN
ncbi:4-(cytidine 5'-diphospho)-2-C-methyl-D-erythritol kinase [Clostridium tarantellae]|uniref:4-diphosphocytidyl-2-C-methyl-D-erythritol kinase n=1 Tax=Clostridium tarantellae TaxID=39493 RepID=A0A6I1MLA3_9CLOT|nr:4-(cytidine 5'-diphospho)-2-C-methyl-D-erythritol kinase [Clostridium tarantellae]MPQ43012.1 4-(cytidine 5'-diphospho)-2-C-methyl-D-erythritol kinase [Clostridium tarantellae]